MDSNLIILITGLLTLAYMLAGLRMMIFLSEKIGDRWMPRTELGTYAAIVFWPLAAIVQIARARFGRANRRVTS